ncbi:MAG: 23S rRNA (pseudouridine(1915)-N(3))-methyltransferase RlmH [Clostridia bacterium]|nr:23S rRNA (pseudouridine(1915)-N(3))-methyltransferase RlmH [Clostridia bacterium]
MQTIEIIAVGTMKEKYYSEGVQEFRKRASAFCNLVIKEVPDERIPANPTAGEVKKIMETEANKLLAAIPSGAYVIALDVVGRPVSSEGLADKLTNLANRGYSKVAFVIGGSLGIHRSVLDRSNESISLSQMTFTHQMARMILTEQIYRAETIINHRPYHR